MINLVNANSSVSMPIAAGTVQLIVTSPPYFGLRKYGAGEGEIGQEASPDEFVEAMRAVGRECWRVLRDDGVMILNLGDSYAANRSYQVPDGKWKDVGNNHASTVFDGLQPGSLMNIPHRVASALAGDGWTWRSTIIWQKLSAMPESVSGWTWQQHRVKVASDWTDENPHPSKTGGVKYERDNRAEWQDCPGCPTCAPNDGVVLRRGSWRPTTAHEYIFVLAKGMGYYGDGIAVREPAKTGWNGSSFTSDRDAAIYAGLGQSERIETTGANPRDVMTFKATPYHGAHYATFPTTLPEWFIRAYTPDAGCCSVCGAPWARIVRNIPMEVNRSERAGIVGRTQTSGTMTKPVESATLGFRRTCDHDAPARPALVLDPFVGSGSTLIAARQLGRDGIGIDLSLDYLMSQARERLGLNAVRAWANGNGKPGGDVSGLPLWRMDE